MIMSLDAKQIINETIHTEGDFINHPLDEGGPTKYGITMPTLAVSRNRDKVSIEDIKNLSYDEAFDIYDKQWMNNRWCRYDEFIGDYGLKLLVFDSAVLFSRRRAGRWLQASLNKDGADLVVDGLIGEKTMRAYRKNEWLVEHLIQDVMVMRSMRHFRNVKKRSDQSAFLVGWMVRTFEKSGIPVPTELINGDV